MKITKKRNCWANMTLVSTISQGGDDKKNEDGSKNEKPKLLGAYVTHQHHLSQVGDCKLFGARWRPSSC